MVGNPGDTVQPRVGKEAMLPLCWGHSSLRCWHWACRDGIFSPFHLPVSRDRHTGALVLMRTLLLVPITFQLILLSPLSILLDYPQIIVIMPSRIVTLLILVSSLIFLAKL